MLGGGWHGNWSLWEASGDLGLVPALLGLLCDLGQVTCPLWTFVHPFTCKTDL